MAPTYAPSHQHLQKHKRTRPIEEEDEEHDRILHLSIRYAEDIDRATRNKNAGGRTYRVIGWIELGDEFLSRPAKGLPDPVWNIEDKIFIGKYEPFQYLHLEVMRVGCFSLDPGTSRGTALVGRTRIPLPKVDQRRWGRYTLVMPNGLAEGFIVVAMKVERVAPAGH